MKPFFVTLLFVAVGAVAAVLPRDVRELRIIVAKPGGLTTRALPYDQQSTEARVRTGEPKVTWNGVGLVELLRGELEPPANREITLAGADGFTVVVPEKAAREGKIFVALQRDGRALASPDGGPQAIFPESETPRLPFLSGIFVGTPEPFVGVRLDGSTSVRIDLRKSGHRTKRRMTACFPAGQHAKAPPKGRIEVSLVPLSAVVGQSGKPVAKVIVHTHLGGTVDVTKHADEYSLAFAWDGETIPPSMGGPVQLVRRGAGTHCLFFVESVEL